MHERRHHHVRPSLARRGTQAALADLRKLGPGGQLVMARRDRLSRLSLDAALVERDVERLGCTVATADAGSTGDGPTDKLVRQILDAVAEHSVALTRQRISDAIVLRMQRGLKPGPAPYGWRRAAKADESGFRPLVEVPSEQKVIEVIVRERKKGRSLGAIAVLLGDLDYSPKLRGSWTAATVGSVLRRAGVPTPKEFQHRGRPRRVVQVDVQA